MTIKNLWTEYDGKGFSAEHADYAERATADEAGNDIASTYATKTENDAKADKVASATSGNFAGLDANGNLTDSGSKPSDFATATALSAHTGNSTIHVTANDKATWTGKQNTVGTKNVTTAVDADTPIATGYSSDTISFNTAGRVASYVSSKVSSDLGITSSAYGGKAATAGSADYATTAGSAGSATNATNATNVNLTGSVKDTSTTNGDTIQVKAGSGTAAEINIVNAKHAASADSATTASSASSVEWADVQNKVSASTTTVGIVQLQDSVGASESSTTTAVTPHAVRDAIDSAVASAYHHAGTKTVAQLVSTLLVPANEGNVYNITDSGTTTSNFIEGAGHPIRIGDNVGICDIGSGVYKFDLLSGFVDLSNYLQKSSTTGLVKNDGSIDTSTYLTKTGDGKDVTSTFTKNASDNSGMVSGSKLSALFTAISNFFASLKALAFKDKVTDSDISGTISDSHIASASTWSGKQSALPASGTTPISQTYAINIDGSAGTVQNVATQGAASNNIARHVWFSDSTTETKRAHSDSLKYTPSTNTLSANISGSASMATEAKEVGDTDSQTQKSVAVSIGGIQHTVSNKSTIITGGQVSTDTLAAETAVNTEGLWVKGSALIYAGNTPAHPDGNYVIISPTGLTCNGNASVTGSLIGNASSATAVIDYADSYKTKKIEIGYTGASLSSATHLAAYAESGGHTYIKDIPVGSVTVGRATADGNGDNIASTYQKKVGLAVGTKMYAPTVPGDTSSNDVSIGDRDTSAPGIIQLTTTGVVYVEVTCTILFNPMVLTGTNTFSVKLKSANSTTGASYSAAADVDSVTESSYGSAAVAKTVTLRGFANVPRWLYLGIVNGMGASCQFFVSGIKVKVITDYDLLPM